MSPVPSTSTLLQATADYLAQQLLPTLQGYHRFQTRIAINALHIAMRDAALAGAASAAERRRLSLLLGHDGELAGLRRELTNAIEQGHLALDATGLVEHLRRTLEDALAINNPRWTGRGAPPINTETCP